MVKDALLEALYFPPRRRYFLDVLVSAQTWDLTIFNPSDLVTSANLTLSEFQENHEPWRLVECPSILFFKEQEQYVLCLVYCS